MAKPGDKIRIHLEGKKIEGILMPNEETNSVIIKLENGYNIGVERKKIRKTETLKKFEEKKKKEEKMAIDKKKKQITILHTGGTIASKVDYKTGGVSAHFTASDLIEMVPELKDIANIETELVANMMSEDMRFSNYKKIASAIKKHADKGTDGIIIGHGTDTLTYTSAALAFMFEKINIPVLVVGSQRSSDRGSTDAASNLICAAEFIAKTDFKGIAICMHDTSDDKNCAILPPTKTRKMHTSSRDAFKPINSQAIAKIDYISRKITFKEKYQSEDEIVLKDKLSGEVGLLKVHTNIKTGLFEFFTKNYKAIVIEGTGLGHAPTNLGEHLKNYDLLKKFIKKGGIVAITSQCIYGRVHPTVYSNLRRLSNIGCIFCEDMLPETAFIKLSWLLANYPKKAERMMTENLRGEINKRLLPENEL